MMLLLLLLLLVWWRGGESRSRSKTRREDAARCSKHRPPPNQAHSKPCAHPNNATQHTFTYTQPQHIKQDVVEPLESVSVTLTPTDKADVREFGAIQDVAETLAKEVLTAPGNEVAVLSTNEVRGCLGGGRPWPAVAGGGWLAAAHFLLHTSLAPHLNRRRLDAKKTSPPLTTLNNNTLHNNNNTILPQQQQQPNSARPRARSTTSSSSPPRTRATRATRSPS